MKLEFKDYEVYDAKDKILGRLASTVAKQILNGKNIVIINAEGAVISGDKKGIRERYRVRLNLRDMANPEHSPYWPRRPDMLVKRIIRGMVPYRQPKGKAAYDRLRVFMGVPEEVKAKTPIEIKTKAPKNLYTDHVTVGELSKLLGYNK